MDFKYFVLIFSLISKISVIQGQGQAIVKIRFLSFDSHGRDSSGDDCDPWPVEDCDPEFKFCLDTAPGSSSLNACPLYSRTSGYYSDDNSMSFDSDILGVPNPISAEVAGYSGIRLKVDVTDIDNNFDDHLDNFDWTYTETPDSSAATATRRTYTLAGRRSSRPSSLSLWIEVYCDTHSYGADCSVYCVPLDQQNDGHYGCDPATGERYCLDGWEDLETDCLVVEDNCEGVTCQNDGVCRDLYDDYTCDCLPGYTGGLCESDINECASDPCLNQGLCTDFVNRYFCECTGFYAGANCAHHVCDYPQSYCQNGGTCMEEVDGSISCSCLPTFAGIHCDVAACETLNCVNGVCENGECDCDANFLGGLCDVRKCDLISCQSGGTCLDDGTCACIPGYLGEYCEEQMRPCREGPCHNSGQCVPLIDVQGAHFECRCQPGYAGSRCETELPIQPAPQHKDDKDKDSDMPLWMIITLLLCGFVVIAVVILAVFLYRRKGKRSPESAAQSPPPSYQEEDLGYDNITMRDSGLDLYTLPTNSLNRGASARYNDYEVPVSLKTAK